MYEQIDEYNAQEVREKELALIDRQLADVGFSTITDLFPKLGYVDLKEVQSKFLTLAGKSNYFDEYELLDLKFGLARMLENMEEKLVLREIALLDRPSDLIDAPISDDYLDYLEQRMSEVILGLSGKQLEASLLDETVSFSLPEFSNSFEVRLQAAEVLAKGRGMPEWKNKAIKARMSAKLSKLEKEVFGENQPQDYGEMDALLAQWFNEFKAISSKLR